MSSSPQPGGRRSRSGGPHNAPTCLCEEGQCGWAHVPRCRVLWEPHPRWPECFCPTPLLHHCPWACHPGDEQQQVLPMFRGHRLQLKEMQRPFTANGPAPQAWSSCGHSSGPESLEALPGTIPMTSET